VPDAPFEEVDLPATTRLGRGGPPDRTLRIAALLAVAGLGLALAKPWDWAGPTAAPPATTIAPGAAASPAEPGRPTPPPRSIDPAAGVGCLSDRLWMAVVDEVDAGAATHARTWTRLDPVPVDDPTDPRIATAHAYAEVVPRIGFCAPTAAGATTSSGTARGAATAGRLAVAAWRVERAAGSAAATAVPLDLAVVAGGTIADGGALYAPPAGAGGPDPGDPEAAWSTGGSDPRRPAGWSTGPARTDVGWLPGTYVFRVALDGARSAGDREGWIAVELRGPWAGVQAPPSGRRGRAPTPEPGPGLAPDRAPGAPSPRP
jgi:hypothetical protein